MAKQTKKKKIQKYQIVHTPAQRFWGIMALVALFICGMMVGVGIVGNSYTPPVSGYEQPQPETNQLDEDKTTCVLIEESLLARLPDGDEFTSANDRITRAHIYANLSERGCPENFQYFYDLANQELAIARALTDDEFNQNETIEVVETYKRLNMQAAAEEIFETAKKLTNPAIDFILEVEKIINEQ